MSDARPIGLFDSGVGGLTLFHALKDLLPHESLLYLGDTAHMPYGDKSPRELQQHALANGHFLMQQGCKLLVIACHTASITSLSALQDALSIPVIGVLEASIQTLLSATRTAHVAILGTPRTIASRFYAEALTQRAPGMHITSIAVPHLASLAERGQFDSPEIEELLRSRLQSFPHPAMDALLLGCTHFPLFIRPLRKVLPSTIQLIDPAPACAQAVYTTLARHDLLAPASHSAPLDQLYTSGDLFQFQQTTSLIFDEKKRAPPHPRQYIPRTNLVRSR